VTTLEQKAKHFEAKERARKQSIFTAYHHALADGNLAVIDKLWNKYPQYHEDFEQYKEISPIN